MSPVFMVPLLAALPVLPLATDPSDPLGYLVNFGAVGIFLVLFVTGQIKTKSEVASLEKQIVEKDDRIRQQDLALSTLVSKVVDFLPQLTKTAQIVEALPRKPEDQLGPVLEQIRATLADIQSKAG